MQRVIGLDIGSYSIKAVEIVNTFKSYEISNFYENIVPPLEDLDPDVVIPACMEQLFQENNLQADRIITAMPGQYISSRIMTFNFSDPRKIETAVMAEVEDAVPFNMDDMIVDHQILGQMEGKTVALVVMTRKTFLRSFLELLQRINIDPKLVDVDSLAFYNLSSYISQDPNEVFSLVDVGHEKTSVCIVQGGVLRMFRSINLGGRYLTEFLARDLETDFADAQRVKHRVARVLTDNDPGTSLSDEDRLVAERMTLASNAIVKELGRTFYAFKTWEKSPLTKLYISGGTTRIANFGHYLADQLEIEVANNRIDEAGLKMNPVLTENMAVMPQSVAIGMRAVTQIKRYSQINMRQGEFAYVQNYESILKGATVAFKVVAVALLILSVCYGFRHYFYQKQITALQEKYVADFTGLFPDQRRRFNLTAKPFPLLINDARRKLQTEIENKRDAVDNFIVQNAGSPAMIVLRDISRAIGEDVQIDVTLFQYTTLPTGGKLVLKAETDGYSSVATIVESLKATPSLKNVEEKGTNKKPGVENVIEFTINADYNGEQAAGAAGQES